MSLKSFTSAINNANSKLKQVNEAAAAAVAELTNQTDAGNIVSEPVTFIVPATGILFGQLETVFKKSVTPTSELILEGDNIRISTNNPVNACKVLKKYGVIANLDGSVVSSIHTA